MCGIAAIVGRTPVSSTQEWAMAEALRHLGPDGQGVVVVAQGKATVQYSPAESPLAGDVVLGHSRLAIIDLSSARFQPMTDEAGALLRRLARRDERPGLRENTCLG